MLRRLSDDDPTVGLILSNVFSRLHRSDLFECARVCGLWNRMAGIIHSRHIILNSDYTTISLFLRTISEKPSYLSLHDRVQRLELASFFPKDTNNLVDSSHIESLYQVFVHLKNIEELIVDTSLGFIFKDNALCQLIASNSPGIKKIVYEPQKNDNYYYYYDSFIGGFSHTLTNSAIISNTSSIEFAIRRFPHLRELHIMEECPIFHQSEVWSELSLSSFSFQRKIFPGLPRPNELPLLRHELNNIIEQRKQIKYYVIQRLTKVTRFTVESKDWFFSTHVLSLLTMYLRNLNFFGFKCGDASKWTETQVYDFLTEFLYFINISVRSSHVRLDGVNSRYLTLLAQALLYNCFGYLKTSIQGIYGTLEIRLSDSTIESGEEGPDLLPCIEIWMQNCSPRAPRRFIPSQQDFYRRTYAEINMDRDATSDIKYPSVYYAKRNVKISTTGNIDSFIESVNKPFLKLATHVRAFKYGYDRVSKDRYTSCLYKFLVEIGDQIESLTLKLPRFDGDKDKHGGVNLGYTMEYPSIQYLEVESTIQKLDNSEILPYLVMLFPCIKHLKLTHFTGVLNGKKSLYYILVPSNIHLERLSLDISPVYYLTKQKSNVTSAEDMVFVLEVKMKKRSHVYRISLNDLKAEKIDPDDNVFDCEPIRVLAEVETLQYITLYLYKQIQYGPGCSYMHNKKDRIMQSTLVLPVF